MLAIKDRRQFLSGGVAVGLVGLSSPGMVLGGQRAETLRANRLKDGLSLLTGAECNIILAIRDDEVVMVDCGRAERAAALDTLVRRQSNGRPVSTLFNTHWHLDNTGGNSRFAEAGAEIIAHENTRLWMTTEFQVEWQDRAYEPRPDIARPTRTFYRREVLDLAGESVETGILPRAHTDGDIYVYFKDSNVLAAGDVVTDGTYPILDYSTGGWLGGMTDACQRLLDIVDDETIIVPGRGGLKRRADIEAQYAMLSTLFDRLVSMLYDGYGPQDMLDANATKEFDETWGEPRLFVTNAYWGLWGHVRELEQVV